RPGNRVRLRAGGAVRIPLPGRRERGSGSPVRDGDAVHRAAQPPAAGRAGRGAGPPVDARGGPTPPGAGGAMTRPALGVAAPIRADPSPASESVAVIVAVSEEPEDLAGIYEEYAPALRGLACPFEFIFALDAPWRAHAGTLAGLEESGEPVRV